MANDFLNLQNIDAEEEITESKGAKLFLWHDWHMWNEWNEWNGWHERCSITLVEVVDKSQ